MADILTPAIETSRQLEEQGLEKVKVAAPLLNNNLTFSTIASTNTLEDTYSALDQVKAAFYRTGGDEWDALYSIGYDTKYEEQEGYNPFNDQLVASLSPQDFDRFKPNIARAVNPDQLIDIVSEINKVKDLDKIWESDSGFVNSVAATVGAIGGAITAPSNIFFGAGILKKLKLGLQSVTKLGEIGSTAASFAALGAASSVARYNITQGTSSRSKEELYSDLVFSTLIGGALGGVVGKLEGDAVKDALLSATSKELPEDSLVKQANDAMIEAGEEAEKISILKKEEDLSVKYNYASAPDIQIKSSNLKLTDYLLKGTLNILKYTSPNYKVLTSNSKIGKLLSYNLVGTELRTNAGEIGVQAIPVEKLVHTNVATDSYRFNKAFEDALTIARKDNISKRELEADINFALNNNVEAKTAAGRQYLNTYSKIYDEYLDLANKHELFGSGVKVTKDGMYYKTVKWDYNKLASQPIKAREIVANALRKAAEKRLNALRAEEGKGAVNIVAPEVKSEFDELEKLLGIEKSGSQVLQKTSNTDAFSKMADEFIANQTGEKSNIVSATNFSPKSLRTKLQVSRADIAELLDDNISIHDMNKLYAKDLHTAVAFKERFGDMNMDNVFEQLSKEYDGLIADAELAGKDTAKLVKEREVVAEQLRGMKFRIQGKKLDGTRQYGVWDTIVDATTAITAQGLMWAGALAQIPDMGGLIVKMANGSVGKLSTQFIKENSKVLQALDKDTLKMMDMVTQGMDHRSLDLFENGLSSASWNTAGRLIGKGKDYIYKLNGMTLINDFTRSIAGEVTAKNIINSAVTVGDTIKRLENELIGDFDLSTINRLMEAGKISKEEQKHFKSLFEAGFSTNDIKYSLLNSFNTHKKIADDVTFANISAWSPNIRGKMFAAVRDIVENQYIISPNAGTKSLWFDNNLGKMAFQFKGFWLKSLASYLARDLQDANPEALFKFMTRSLLGSVAYYARKLTIMPADQIDTRPQTLVYEGLVRGGSFGVFDVTAGFLDGIGSATNTNIGPASWLGLRKNRRYARQDNEIINTILGPSEVFINDTTKLIGSVGSGDFKEQGIKYTTKYAPVINTFYARPIIRALTE